MDVDAEQAIAQTFQVQSVPSVIAIIKGQPVPLFQGAMPEPQLRQVMDELIKVAAENGVSAPGDVAAQDGALMVRSSPKKRKIRALTLPSTRSRLVTGMRPNRHIATSLLLTRTMQMPRLV